MGTRGQICVRGNHGDVYLYRHFDAKNLLNDVYVGLSYGQRWDDSEYLARMIFEQMISGNTDKVYGFGISVTKHSDIDLLLIVDCNTHNVIIEKKPLEIRIPFDEYIKTQVSDMIVFPSQESTSSLPG
jgi:hypothetical protein